MGQVGNITEHCSVISVNAGFGQHYTVCRRGDLSCTLISGNLFKKNFPQKVLGVSLGQVLKSVLILSALRGPFVNRASGPVLESGVSALGALPGPPPGQCRVIDTQEHP